MIRISHFIYLLIVFVTPDTDGWNLYNSAKSKLDTNLAEAKVQANRALEFFKNENHSEGIGKSLILLGYIYDEQHYLTEAAIYYYEALEQDIDIHSKYLCNNNLAIIYQKLRDLAKAEQHYLISLELTRKYNETEQIKVLINLGIIYRKIGDLEKASDNYIEAMTLLDQMLVSDSDPLRLRVYNAIGLCYKDLKEYEKARSYYHHVINKAENQPKYRWRAYHNLAWTYYEQAHYDTALLYYEKALTYKITGSRAISYIDMGSTYAQLGDTLQAKSFWRQAIDEGIDPNDMEEFIVFKHLAVVSGPEVGFSILSQYSDYLYAYTKNQDDLTNIRNKYHFGTRINQYLERKEQISLRNQTLTWVIILVASLAGLFLLMYLLWKIKERRRSKYFQDTINGL